MPPGGPFRPIHYMGNKLRALDAIERTVAELATPGARVCDLFAGSGVVTAHLARHYRVLAVDVQVFARVLADAFLHPAALSDDLLGGLLESATEQFASIRGLGFAELMTAEDDAIAQALESRPEALCDIVEFGSVAAFDVEPAPVPSRIAELAANVRTGGRAPLAVHYGGAYFAYEQAAELDALRAAVDTLPDPWARNTALAALISTASDIVSTVGNHFAQPMRARSGGGDPKVVALRALAARRKQRVNDVFLAWVKRYNDLPRPLAGGYAVAEDFRAVLPRLPKDTAAVYADPPYTRDHYSRFYHVLETIALGDSPGISVTQGAVSRGLYRVDRHQSPFCIASQVAGAFDALFAGVSGGGIPLVLSYSPLSEGTTARPRTRLMTIDQIEAAALRHFRRVDVRAAGDFAHSKFNASHLNASLNYGAEVLVVCRP